MSTQHEPATGVPTCYRHPDRESYIRCQRCGRTICPECMRDAAVGHQCPQCVAEGNKQTRAGRTTYGGMRPTDATWTSGVLIALNAAVWLAITLTGGGSSRLVQLLALRPSGLCPAPGGYVDATGLSCPGGGILPGVADGAVWQLVTSGFTHVALIHIGFNMFALYALGPQLESVLGRARFLALYLLSLLGGSVAVMWLGQQYGATVGASGAIYGLFGALAVIARKTGGDLRQIAVLLGVNLLITFAVPGISWQGHLGGLVVGAAVAALLVYSPRGPRRTTVQVAGMAGIALLLVLALVARVALLT